MNILNHTSTFYLLTNLNTFDGIIRYDFLREIEANVDTENGYLYYRRGKEIKASLM